jgi:hypothetical protein
MTTETMERPAAQFHEMRFQLTEKQRLAWDALHDPSIDEVLYGGAKGGGKTVFGCVWSFVRALEIIQTCAIEPQSNQYPPVVGFIGRKQSVDFTSTTLNTWKRLIPASEYEILQQQKLIVIQGAVAIQYGGMDDSDTVKKFNSAEYAYYFVDQAEECTEGDIALLRGTLRLKVNGINPGYKGLLTANPAICWLKPAFITNPQDRTRFIRALPSDNKFLAEGYVDRLKKAFAFNPPLLKAYLEGSWDGLDAAFVVIPSDDIERSVNNKFPAWNSTRRITVCDVSESGDDETVIYDMENASIIKEEIYSHRDLMDTVGRIMAHAKQNKSSLVCVDKVGLGAGVYSRLQEIYTTDKTMRVYGFDSRISAPGDLNSQTFKNYKTYAWFKAREMFKDRKCCIPDDPTLKSQLASVTYHFTAGDVLMIDAKDDLKERMGGSPDRADAYVMGLDALDKADPITIRDPYRVRDSKTSFKPDLV